LVSQTKGRRQAESVIDCRVLRKILGPEKNDVRRDGRRLRIEKLYALYSFPYKVLVR
jgi:hypothetical protein